MPNIKKDYKKDLTTLLKEFFEEKEQLLTNTSYVGKIVDNNDPEQLGRCRIRVYGVYGNDIPDDELPWALPAFSFIGSELGSFIVPPNNCIVSVYFDNGELSKPIYTTKIIKTGKQPSDKNKNNKYPDNLIFFQLDNGDKFTIDRQNGETIYEQRAGIVITMYADGSYTLAHRTGTIFEIDKLGNVTLKSGSSNPISTVTIQQGAVGQINIGNNAIIPCPDAPTCFLTGGPLAINTNIPGMRTVVP